MDRKDWALENSLAVAFVAVLVVSHRRVPLTNISYTLIFLFLCLHTIGAHYTYSGRAMVLALDRRAEPQRLMGRTFAAARPVASGGIGVEGGGIPSNNGGPPGVVRTV